MDTANECNTLTPLKIGNDIYVQRNITMTKWILCNISSSIISEYSTNRSGLTLTIANINDNDNNNDNKIIKIFVPLYVDWDEPDKVENKPYKIAMQMVSDHNDCFGQIKLCDTVDEVIDIINNIYWEF
jgi:hypothetical protein